MTVELDFRAQLMLLDEAGHVTEEEKSLSLIEPLQTSFLNNAAKIQNLIVTGLFPEWFTFFGEAFSHCESLMLYWPTSHTNGWVASLCLLDLTELSSLHHLCIKELYTPLVLPWATLTTLQLCGMPINLCVESLVKCPNLIKFEATGTHTHSSTSRDPPHELVVLEYLESLTWCNRDDDDVWSSAFLCHIRFSKLRILKWFDRGWKEEFSEELHSGFTIFCSHLPMTLQVLELTDIWYGHPIMKTLLTGVPCLLELALNDCSPDTEDVIMSMIGRPAAGPVEGILAGRAIVSDRPLEGPKITPYLRKLMVLGEDTETQPGLVVEMLEALCSARVTREDFRLELTYLRKYAWLPSILARLKRLAESGFRFEILAGSDALDYMLLC